MSILVTQSSFPVLESNARNRLSFVAPINTTPSYDDRTTHVEASCVLLSVRYSSVTPSGTCHTVSPVLALVAVSLPHGGR